MSEDAVAEVVVAAEEVVEAEVAEVVVAAGSEPAGMNAA
jgi:hypothetical protein